MVIKKVLYHYVNLKLRCVDFYKKQYLKLMFKVVKFNVFVSLETTDD